MEPPETEGPAQPWPWQRAKELGLPADVEPPMTVEELESAMAVPAHSRRWDPHKCLFNEHPKDLPIYDYAQCRTVLPDPTKIRYCLKHAIEVGYPLSPQDVEEMSKAEARVGLQGLMPTAVQTLQEVMRDPEAPAGARAKAATDVLDRTGLHPKADLDVRVGAQVIDMTSLIKERLAAKKAQLGLDGISGVPDGSSVVVEQLPEPGINGDGA